MTNATITTSSIVAPTTHLALANAWSTAMQNAGFTQVGTNSASGDEFRYLEYDYTSGSTYTDFACEIAVFNDGTTVNYLRFQAGSDITGGTTLNNIGITAQQSNQDDTGGAWLSQTFTFTEIAHPEVRGVIIDQNGTYAGHSLFFRPLTIPSWVDENAYPFAFCKTGFACSRVSKPPRKILYSFPSEV